MHNGKQEKEISNWDGKGWREVNFYNQAGVCAAVQIGILNAALYWFKKQASKQNTRAFSQKTLV